MLFQSTRPLRGATELDDNSHNTPEHFNPRAPCGARPQEVFIEVEGINFNPRAPCGARLPHCPGAFELHQFQSTRPLRGATLCFARKDGGQCHFNPRAPCGARHINAVEFLHGVLFQSTRPLRGATYRSTGAADSMSNFNPRAPCGARPARSWPWCWTGYFNPRAPCGARRTVIAALIAWWKFQSTRPLRGATDPDIKYIPVSVFQSTRPLRGATVCDFLGVAWEPFQSTRPLRGATAAECTLWL